MQISTVLVCVARNKLDFTDRNMFISTARYILACSAGSLYWFEGISSYILYTYIYISFTARNSLYSL